MNMSLPEHLSPILHHLAALPPHSLDQCPAAAGHPTSLAHADAYGPCVPTAHRGSLPSVAPRTTGHAGPVHPSCPMVRRTTQDIPGSGMHHRQVGGSGRERPPSPLRTPGMNTRPQLQEILQPHPSVNRPHQPNSTLSIPIMTASPSSPLPPQQSTPSPAPIPSIPRSHSQKKGPKSNKKVIHVYVDDNEYQQITQRAKRRSISVSEYLRRRGTRSPLPPPLVLAGKTDQQTSTAIITSLRLLDRTTTRIGDQRQQMTDEDLQQALDLLRQIRSDLQKALGRLVGDTP